MSATPQAQTPASAPFPAVVGAKRSKRWKQAACQETASESDPFHLRGRVDGDCTSQGAADGHANGADGDDLAHRCWASGGAHRGSSDRQALSAPCALGCGRRGALCRCRAVSPPSLALVLCRCRVSSRSKGSGRPDGRLYMPRATLSACHFFATHCAWHLWRTHMCLLRTPPLLLAAHQLGWQDGVTGARKGERWAARCDR